ncbi:MULTISPECIES: FadR/GntR family transcriptional regulator [Pseudomonas]|jgi:GntR family transcriptional repressor for pyruvate dehydrogenase complex|uniref:FadR/GntR family transcriptional regulator n=1 Tax=Pseudomonas TaxID=286 RepID=UPI0017816986|nr:MULTISPECIES: FadR/GntR family transcriptional regulator [Pseudomonas]MBD9443441.1 FadR family transcriptional regulator [Pseudomonas sp. PDM04]
MSEMNVQPVSRRPHLAEHIARSLSDEIASGRLRPGDRLPTEQFLSQNFGVSRNVVREGIATLRAQGLIQSRQGVGVFVAAAPAAERAPLPENAPLLDGDNTIRNMFEVRAILESQAAALTATHMTPRKLKTIQDAVLRMQYEGEPTLDTVNADLDFHRAVAAASGNDYLETMIRTVLEPMRALITMNFARRGPVFSNIPHAARGEHEELVQAFIDRDAGAARQIMGQHIVSAASRFGYEIRFF